MKINSTDLQNALKVVRTTVGSSSDIASHYIFRSREGGLEALSTDGARTFSSCIVPNTKVEEDITFTVEARRTHALLDSLESNQVMDFTITDGEVTVRTLRGKVLFSSLDPSLFPYWDEALSGAKVTAKILSDRLHAAFTHAKQFIYDQEAKAPHLCVAEFRNGVLHSTDQMAVSLVRMSGMADCGLRVFVKDLSSVLSFLQTAKGTEVEVLECDRAFFLRRNDGAVFGETVYGHRFPDFNANWDMEDDQSWEVSQEELLAGVRFLQSGAKLDEPRVRFQRRDKEVFLSMTSVSGKLMPLSVPLNEFVQKEGGVTEMPVFAITDDYIFKMLNANGNPKVRLGVTKKGTGGWVRVRDDRGTDSYLTTVAWLKNA